MQLDYTRLRDLRLSIYVTMVAAIALVLLGGAAVRGSQRWIELPLFRFQPSELAKVLLCVSLAAFAFDRVRRPFGIGRPSRSLPSVWGPRRSSSYSPTSAPGSRSP